MPAAPEVPDELSYAATVARRHPHPAAVSESPMPSAEEAGAMLEFGEDLFTSDAWLGMQRCARAAACVSFFLYLFSKNLFHESMFANALFGRPCFLGKPGHVAVRSPFVGYSVFILQYTSLIPGIGWTCL